MGNGPEVFGNLINILSWPKAEKRSVLRFLRPKGQLSSLARRGNDVAALRAAWNEAKDVWDSKSVDLPNTGADAEITDSLLDIRSRIDVAAGRNQASEVESACAIFDALDVLRVRLDMEPSARPRMK